MGITTRADPSAEGIATANLASASNLPDELRRDLWIAAGRPVVSGAVPVTCSDVKAAPVSVAAALMRYSTDPELLAVVFRSDKRIQVRATTAQNPHLDADTSAAALSWWVSSNRTTTIDLGRTFGVSQTLTAVDAVTAHSERAADVEKLLPSWSWAAMTVDEMCVASTHRCASALLAAAVENHPDASGLLDLLWDRLPAGSPARMALAANVIRSSLTADTSAVIATDPAALAAALGSSRRLLADSGVDETVVASWAEVLEDTTALLTNVAADASDPASPELVTALLLRATGWLDALCPTEVEWVLASCGEERVDDVAGFVLESLARAASFGNTEPRCVLAAASSVLERFTVSPSVAAGLAAASSSLDVSRRWLSGGFPLNVADVAAVEVFTAYPVPDTSARTAALVEQPRFWTSDLVADTLSRCVDDVSEIQWRRLVTPVAFEDPPPELSAALVDLFFGRHPEPVSPGVGSENADRVLTAVFHSRIWYRRRPVAPRLLVAAVMGPSDSLSVAHDVALPATGAERSTAPLMRWARGELAANSPDSPTLYGYFCEGKTFPPQVLMALSANPGLSPGVRALAAVASADAAAVESVLESVTVADSELVDVLAGAADLTARWLEGEFPLNPPTAAVADAWVAVADRQDLLRLLSATTEVPASLLRWLGETDGLPRQWARTAMSAQFSTNVVACCAALGPDPQRWRLLCALAVSFDGSFVDLCEVSSAAT